MSKTWQEAEHRIPGISEIILETAFEDYNNIKLIYKSGSASYSWTSPTSNCQLFSIGGFDLILFSPNMKEILKWIIVHMGKKMILVDINAKIVPKVEELFQGYIISKTLYTSTNKSPMAILLIDTLITTTWK